PPPNRSRVISTKTHREAVCRREKSIQQVPARAGFRFAQHHLIIPKNFGRTLEMTRIGVKA
ncbi:MAG: hypothetical protein RBR47_04840, partial [Bacteroidales bacterium]|nr:hypothetical protein [Bacteroidales bacterium]MDD4741933.1 hypothetical protein [Bacteroidales bacterium]MDY0334263.1 hypothetical protein [Bacteroidales bacterium]